MGVLNNSKSSVVDCYNVATVSGGHSTYANGGVGGVVGQFGDGSIVNSYNYGNVTLGEGLVCNNLGGVIGRDMKRSGAQVENVYYLDSSCANASTSGADERVAAVSAADFAGESFLRKLNADGCFILRSGKYPELEMSADLVGSDPVLTVVLKDSHGSVTGEQSFTARQLSGLSQTGAVGYQYWKKDTENLVAATKYVTLETLLKAAGADFTPGMTVSAADATGYSGTLGYRDYQTCRWYIDGSGVKSDAPAALALCWNSGEGAVEQVAAGAVDTGSIRFCYGISEDQYGSAAGKRLVSGVVTVTVQTCVHDGESQDVPGTPATCTESGLTDGHLCLICGQVHGQAEDPDYQPEQPTQPENPGVKTGDESYVVLWSAALLLGGAALVLLPRKKRS